MNAYDTYRLALKNGTANPVKKEKKKPKGEKSELQSWYEYIMKNEKAVCWETGQVIGKSDTKGWHGSIAHILPKKLFPSVATHPMNYLILKMWGGTHGQFDSSWENAQKMRVWPLAVQRFKMLEKDIAPAERKHLPDCLLRVSSNKKVA